MKATAAVVAILAVGAALLWADPDPRLTDFGELRDYSSWQEVTSGPHQVLLEISTLCAPIAPLRQPDPLHPGAVDLQGKDRFIRVYASPQIAHLLPEPRVESYPEGAVVAKVKLIEGTSEPTGVALVSSHT